MKKIPIPDKQLRNDKDIVQHIESLIFNCMEWLQISGYVFYVFLPKNKDHLKSEDAGLSIVVEYPYKKFNVSVQQDSIDKMLTQPISNVEFWEDIESSVFHECAHILLWKTEELAKRRYTTPTEISDENETVTDHLTHIITSMLQEIRKKRATIPAKKN